MKGSIRTLIGFLMAFGAVGGIETGSDLVSCVVVAALGLMLMASGVSVMKKEV